jgi:hypothetical protein
VIAAMGARGFSVYVGQTMRSQAEQTAAQARGTTSANQSRSWHQLGRAADLRKRNLDGSVDESTHDEAFFRALFEEAQAAGLRSLAFREDGSRLLIHTSHGDVWDAGHVEFREPFGTLAEAFAAERTKVA